MKSVDAILGTGRRGFPPPSTFESDLPYGHRFYNVEYLNGGWISINSAYTYVPRTDVADPIDMWVVTPHNINLSGACVTRICHDGTNYVFAPGNNKIWTTTDPLIDNNWTEHTIALNFNVYDFYYNGSYFVAVGAGGAMSYCATASGVWNTIATPFGTDSVRSVYYDNGYWAAVAANKIGYINNVNPSGAWSLAASPIGAGYGADSIVSDGTNWGVSAYKYAAGSHYIYYTGASPATGWTGKNIGDPLGNPVGTAFMSGANGYWYVNARDGSGADEYCTTNSISGTWNCRQSSVYGSNGYFYKNFRYHNNKWCMVHTGFNVIAGIDDVDINGTIIGLLSQIYGKADARQTAVYCSGDECAQVARGGSLRYSDQVDNAWSVTFVGGPYSYGQNSLTKGHNGWLMSNYGVTGAALGVFGLVSGPNLSSLTLSADTTNRYKAVASSDTHYAAFCSTNYNMYYSTDPSGPWLVSANIPTLPEAYGFIYGDGYWVVNGYSSYFYTNDIAGGVWTEVTPTSVGGFYLAYGGGYFVFYGGAGTNYYTNDITSGVLTAMTAPWVKDIVYGGGRWYGVRNTDLLYYANTPGGTWTSITLPYGDVRTLGISNDRIVMLTENSSESEKIIVST